MLSGVGTNLEVLSLSVRSPTHTPPKFSSCTRPLFRLAFFQAYTICGCGEITSALLKLQSEKTRRWAPQRLPPRDVTEMRRCDEPPVRSANTSDDCKSSGTGFGELRPAPDGRTQSSLHVTPGQCM